MTSLLEEVTGPLQPSGVPAPPLPRPLVPQPAPAPGGSGSLGSCRRGSALRRLGNSGLGGGGDVAGWAGLG